MAESHSKITHTRLMVFSQRTACLSLPSPHIEKLEIHASCMSRKALEVTYAGAQIGGRRRKQYFLRILRHTMETLGCESQCMRDAVNEAAEFIRKKKRACLTPHLAESHVLDKSQLGKHPDCLDPSTHCKQGIARRQNLG